MTKANAGPITVIAFSTAGNKAIISMLQLQQAAKNRCTSLGSVGLLILCSQASFIQTNTSSSHTRWPILIRVLGYSTMTYNRIIKHLFSWF